MKAENIVLGINIYSHELVKALLKQGEKVLWVDIKSFEMGSDIASHYLKYYYQEESRIFHKIAKNNYANKDELVALRAKIIKNILSKTKEKLSDIELDLTKHENLKIITGEAIVQNKQFMSIKTDTGEKEATHERLYICNSKTRATLPGIELSETVEKQTELQILENTTLPKSVAIIGINKSNLELADILSNLGVPVKMFEKKTSNKTLPYLDRALFNLVIKQLMMKNAEIYFNTTIAMIDNKRGRYTLESKNNQKFSSDSVLTDTSTIYVDDIGLKELELVFDEGGVMTNSSNEVIIKNTAARNILALGESNSNYSTEQLQTSPAIMLSNNTKKRRSKKTKERQSEIDQLKVLNLNLTKPVAYVGYDSEKETFSRIIRHPFSSDFTKISYEKDSGVVVAISMSGVFRSKSLGYGIDSVKNARNITEVEDYVRTLVLV